MPNDDLETIVANRMYRGDTTRDQVLKEEIVREILYTESGSISVGTELVAVQEMPQRAVHFTYPGEMDASYPVAPDTVGDRQRVTWAEFSMQLRRAQVRYGIADETKLAGMADLQMDTTQERASEALARRKDENILSTLADGAYSENEVTYGDGEEWNSDDFEESDIVDGLFNLWKKIIVNAPLATLDNFNMAVALPAEVYTEVNKPMLINNVQQQIEQYLGTTFGFQLYPHKVGFHPNDKIDLQDTAIMVMPGSETAIHGELSASSAAAQGVPLVEEERQFGKGEQYIVSQWFNTGVMSHESQEEGVSPRIAIATGVNENSDEEFEYQDSSTLGTQTEEMGGAT